MQKETPVSIWGITFGGCQVLCHFCNVSNADIYSSSLTNLQLLGFPDPHELKPRAALGVSDDSDMNGWHLRHFGTSSGRRG